MTLAFHGENNLRVSMYSWPEAGVPAAQGRPDWTWWLQELSTAVSGRSPGGRVDGLGVRAGMHCLGKSSKCFLQKLRGEQGTISLVTPEQRSLWEKQWQSPALSQTGPTPTAGEFRRQLTWVRIPCDVGTVASQKMRRDLLRLTQLWGGELGEPGSAWCWSLRFVHRAWRQHRDCVPATAVAAATGAHLKRTSYMTGALHDFI